MFNNLCRLKHQRGLTVLSSFQVHVEVSSSEIETEGEVCPICKTGLKYENDRSITKLRQRGADTINAFSRKRGRDDVAVRAGQGVHSFCKNTWTNLNVLSQSQRPVPRVERKGAPGSLGPYNSKMDCLFCGQTVDKDIHGHDEPTSEVKTGSLPENVLAVCEKRADDWAVAVKDRIRSLGSDLRAAACVYHIKCIVNFRRGRLIPVEFRPESASQQEGAAQQRNKDGQQDFLRMCQYLEDNDVKQLTIVVTRTNLILYQSCNLWWKPLADRSLKRSLETH